MVRVNRRTNVVNRTQYRRRLGDSYELPDRSILNPSEVKLPDSNDLPPSPNQVSPAPDNNNTDIGGGGEAGGGVPQETFKA